MSVLAGPRACLPEEYEALKAALNQAFRPTGGDLAKDVPLLFDRANLENLRVLSREDGIVSHAGVCFRTASLWGQRVRVACIGGVFTRREDQGQGLATEVLSHVLARAVSQSELTMITGDRPLYRRLGFMPVPAGVRFRWDPAAVTWGEEVAVHRASLDDVDALGALHAREPVRLERSADQWRKLLTAGQVMGWPGAVWLVGERAAPRAYVAVQAPPGEQDGTPRPARVLETAGEPAAAAAAALRLAQELVVPIHAAAPFVSLFAAHDIRPTSRQLAIAAKVSTSDVPVIPWLGLDYV